MKSILMIITTISILVLMTYISDYKGRMADMNQSYNSIYGSEVK